MKYLLILLLIIVNCSLIIPFSYARTTPEDILNSQKQVYNQKLTSYSPQNKQKLTDWDKKIAEFNKEKTDKLSEIMERQGYILEEYIRRNEIAEAKITDGKTRNLSNEIENARYWLTYAHEAVAYQAAHVYVFNLTAESNINNNILSTISNMQTDLNTLNGKVNKSQKIIENLVVN